MSVHDKDVQGCIDGTTFMALAKTSMNQACTFIQNIYSQQIHHVRISSVEQMIMQFFQAEGGKVDVSQKLFIIMHSYVV